MAEDRQHDSFWVFKEAIKHLHSRHHHFARPGQFQALSTTTKHRSEPCLSLEECAVWKDLFALGVNAMPNISDSSSYDAQVTQATSSHLLRLVAVARHRSCADYAAAPGAPSVIEGLSTLVSVSGAAKKFNFKTMHNKKKAQPFKLLGRPFLN
ncbi:hypothetical protein SCHPADRAFT_947239 [Schizopora paradoxa]|uniref:Uncharacterized protein n=1 Tax=Schizopora paradoxa TaxID=27342 RepID=A0A0H2RJS9_9AGAM|nr:hypothetical protein SCHPADRAFT_947239 [Schizopora paradoxa]